MKVLLLATVALITLFYFGVNFSIKRSTACVGVKDSKACITGSVSGEASATA